MISGKSRYSGRGETRSRAKSGQVVILAMLVFLAVAFLVLANIDSFLSVKRKEQTQNAGDAAALAAAVWQASTLNLEGELNLMHALAACQGDREAIDGINAIQTRLTFAGPLVGLFAAQTAAKRNHMFVDGPMTELVLNHAQDVRDIYSGEHSGNGTAVYPEPWPGAWLEYADMIEAAASDGIAAGPGNMEFFDTRSGHTLLNREFYQAVLGRDWCWFHFNDMTLLVSYEDFHSWAPLPPPDEKKFGNSEIFGVDIMMYKAPLAQFISPEDFSKAAMDWGYNDVTEIALITNKLRVLTAPHTWAIYGGSWGKWTAIDPYGEEKFPVVGPVKKEYDYDGAAAVVRTTGVVTPVSPGATPHASTWLAAAKPFGFLDTDEGRKNPASPGGLVLPAYRNVRLIPLDSAHGGNLNSADPEWVNHIRRHLAAYLEKGVKAAIPGCSYCDALRIWENRSFREYGIEWLKYNSGKCVRRGGGGGGGGGTHHGH